MTSELWNPVADSFEQKAAEETEKKLTVFNVPCVDSIEIGAWKH